MAYIHSSGESYFWGSVKTEDGAVGREGKEVSGREKRKRKTFPISQLGTEVMGFPDEHPPLSILSIAAGHPP